MRSTWNIRSREGEVGALDGEWASREEDRLDEIRILLDILNPPYADAKNKPQQMPGAQRRQCYPSDRQDGLLDNSVKPSTVWSRAKSGERWSMPTSRAVVAAWSRTGPGHSGRAHVAGRVETRSGAAGNPQTVASSVSASPRPDRQGGSIPTAPSCDNPNSRSASFMLCGDRRGVADRGPRFALAEALYAASRT